MCHLAEVPRVNFAAGGGEELQFVDGHAVLSAALGLEGRDQLACADVPDLDALVLVVEVMVVVAVVEVVVVAAAAVGEGGRGGGGGGEGSVLVVGM